MNIQKQKEFTVEVEKADKILIVANPARANEYYAALGLVLALREIGNYAFLADKPFALEFNTDFKKELHSVFWDNSQSKELIITVSNKAQIDELRYEQDQQQNQLKIYLKPKYQGLTAKDVNFEQGSVSWDLIILVGIESLKELNELAPKHLPSFFNAKLIYVGHKQPQEQLATLQFINEQVLGIAEIVFELLSASEKIPFNELVANVLLAGLIQDSQSFGLKGGRVSPNLLKISAELLELGGDFKKALSLFTPKTGGDAQIHTPELKDKDQQSVIFLNEPQNKIKEPKSEEILTDLIRKANEDKERNFRWLTLDNSQTKKLSENDLKSLTKKLIQEPHDSLKGAFILIEAVFGNPRSLFKCWFTHSNNNLLSQLASLLNVGVTEGLINFEVKAATLNEAEIKVLKLAKAAFEL